MKIKRILIYISALLLFVSLAFVLSACSDSLDKPSSLNLEMDTQTLRWQRIPSASSYEIVIDNDERVRTTTATYISLEFLEAGDHTVKVRAISNNEEIEPSEWSVFTFTRKPESGLRYKLINNQTEYQLVGIGTASGDVVMESEFRGKPVTSIAEKAFNNTQKLTSIVIASSVKEIGKNAFTKCTELVSVSFENGSKLRTIGEYAFQSCKKLQSIALPEGLSSLPSYMFSWCVALESVSLPSTLEVIGSYAFSNCELLKNINFPESLSAIQEYAFSDCTAIETVNLPDGLKSIAIFTFSNCSAVKELTFGEGIEAIGDAAFFGCASLNTVVLPDSLKTIGVQAFASCPALGDVTLGEGVISIGAGAFYNTKVINEAETEGLVCVGGWVIGSKDATLTRIRIKEEDGICGIADYAFAEYPLLETLDLEGVKYIGSYAFAACAELWEVMFDDELLTLGDYAFYYCPKLTDLELGDSLLTIGNYAFRGCSMLQSTYIDLPDTLTAIGTYAFHETYAYNQATDVVYIDDWVVGLKENLYTDIVIDRDIRGIASYSFYKAMILYSVTLPDSLEYIGRAAFYQCSYTQIINLPKNLKYIGDYAFFGCPVLGFGDGRITIIPEGTEYIGRSAFYGCTGMVGLNIPSSVKTIGDYAFYQCVNLGNSQIGSPDNPSIALRGDVIISEGVESIGNKAFQECIGIVSITLPKSLKYMGERAFYKCISLEYLDMRCELEYIPAYAFFGCTSLERIDFSDKIREIGTYAFRGCTALPKIVIGNGVEKVGNYAFFGCTGVQEIIIPSGVREIGNFAFRGCSAVSSVLIPESVEVIGMHAFYSLNKASLYCEADSVLPYWNERWNSSYRPVFWGCEFSDEGSFVVSFVKGENNPENPEATGGISAPYREGYSFMGWSESVDGETLISADKIGAEYNGKTLYPIFVKSDYIIEFIPNRPASASYNIVGVMIKIGCLFETDFNLPMNEFSLIGWTFKGWSTTPDGAAIYTDGELITEPIATEGGSTVTLYAVWEPKPYTIVFEPNKPTGASGELIGYMPNQETTLDSIITLYPNQYSIEGWKFLGWSGIPVGEAQIPDGYQIGISATEEEITGVTLYAIWAPISYTVSFDANIPADATGELSGAMLDQRYEYDSYFTLPECTFYLEGYTFMGWSTTPDGNSIYPDGAEIYNLASEDGKVVKLYAVWRKN